MSETVVYAATAALCWIVWHTGHRIGDHWVQTHTQALTKAQPGRGGRRACAKHVATLTLTQLVLLALVAMVTGIDIHPAAAVVALTVNASTHYWADRRTTLHALARAIGKDGFYQLGSPRPGHDDNPHLGTGAYQLDQDWHGFWLLIAALITAAPSLSHVAALTAVSVVLMAAAIAVSWRQSVRDHHGASLPA
ncbi:hypothetical protein [Halostreptopolyspora alba]|uniref:hypothetical protein n=1 Tax=Halostreptopolyspora alba TaxID=2487137 RepID=UPI0026D5A04F